MNVYKYTLGSDKARKTHRDIIISDNSYSLTITLNPRFYCLPVNEQYNKSTREIRTIMDGLSHYYNEMFITPEFTKDYNVHYHCYFTMPCDGDVMVFEQNWKRLRNQTKTIGFNYRLKKIDEVTTELTNYPFKDIERTTKYSKVENCLFNPYHLFIKGQQPVLREDKVKKSGAIDIIKFIEFVNSNKNI